MSLIFHRVTICYFGGSTSFGQIVHRRLGPYNRETLVQVRGKLGMGRGVCVAAMPTFQPYGFFDAQLDVACWKTDGFFFSDFVGADLVDSVCLACGK